MKLWRWDRFAILLVVCVVALFAIALMVFRSLYDIWPYALLLALILAAGATFVLGLLNVLEEQSEDINYLTKRIRELEKKIEDK